MTKSKRWTFSTLFLLCLPVLAGGGGNDEGAVEGTFAEHGRYIALLIGINEYAQGTGLQKLVGPTRDVDTIGDLLETYCGFQVTILKNEKATHRAITDALGDLRSTTRKTDNLLIWYAGHGNFGKGQKEQGHWLPHDAKTDKQHIAFTSVLLDLQEIPAKRILLVSDSCYAGGLATGELSVPKHVQIITSGQLNEVDDTYANRRSPFAEEFVRALTELRVNAKDGRPTMGAGAVYRNVQKGLRKKKSTKIISPWRWPLKVAKDREFTFRYSAYYPTAAEMASGISAEKLQQFDTELDGVLKLYRVKDSDDRCDMVLIDSTWIKVDGIGERHVPSFLMDRNEVTVGQFRKYLGQRGLSGPRYWNERGYSDDRKPVVGITFDLARAYALWADKDLPTEFEWEAAAQGVRAQKKAPEWRPFPPVTPDKDDRSRFGVQSMRLGVREWCWLSSRKTERAVIRGGSIVAANLRQKYKPIRWRQESDPAIPANNLGFRCVYRITR